MMPVPTTSTTHEQLTAAYVRLTKAKAELAEATRHYNKIMRLHAAASLTTTKPPPGQ